MKKGIPENNPALELWKRVVLDGRIYKLAQKHRVNLLIPKEGFRTSEECDTWIEKFKKDKKDDLRIKLVNDFIEESKEIIPYVGVLNEVHFKLMMMEFIYYNNVGKESFNAWKNSEMEVFIIQDKKIIFSNQEIPDGVYIKLQPFSAMSTITKYVDSSKELIKGALDIFAKMKNLKKPKRFKINQNFERDAKILYYSQYSKKELEERSGIKAKDKNILISSIMKEFGLKVKGEEKVNIDIIKIVKQRRKLKK